MKMYKDSEKSVVGVHLSPELEELLQDLYDSGKYTSKIEIIREAINSFKKEERSN